MISKPSFLIRSFVLTTWAGFFTWLVLTGEMRRYIGPRNYWVVIFGAVSLFFAAVMHTGLGERRSPERGIELREAIGLLTVLLPILVVLAIPDPSLGALAASKKAPGGIIGATVAGQPAAAISNGELSLEAIDYASRSSSYAATVGITEGIPVKLVGFVTHPDPVPGTFHLTRFSIFCCAADAVPYRARVVVPEGSPDYDDDQWLEVKGTLAEDDTGFFIEATQIRSIPEPTSPYA